VSADHQQLLAQLATTLELQQHRVQLADGSLQRYRQLAAGGHIAVLAVQEREAELLEQQQRLAELQRALLESRRQLHAARAARQESQRQSVREQAAGERGLAALDQELAEAAARAGWLVTAPVAGRISAVRIRRGDEVAAGQLLLTLFNPAAPLEVELHAPSRAAGQMRIGQVVSLRYQAFPYQQFGQYRGTIQRISGNALQPEELAPEVAAAAARGGEALYRVSVRLADETVRAGAGELRLQPGTRVDASVRLESRRLYQWLLAPLADVVTPR
jgi:membrane fusion protein